MARINHDLENLLGFPRRRPGSPLKKVHKDLAASLQALTNEAMVKLAQHVRAVTGKANLCLAGGVALNCVANAEIFRGAGFRQIFIQPAAGDAGGALGAAYVFWNQIERQPRTFVMRHAFWGPGFSNTEIKKVLDDGQVFYEYLSTDALVEKLARLIANQNVVGWFQGRLEWGPRALGNRSILADPRNPENWQRVNQKIKFRESFRPFAPAVLREKSEQYFDLGQESPFMLFTAQVRTRDIPAVTHVDGSARPQTVDKQTNPLFHNLLLAFEGLTGCPVLISTSFNVRDEPMVTAPQEALQTFLATEMDFLVMGNYLIHKT